MKNTPFSLGISDLNTSIDPEIIKEGHIMSIFINKGSKIPYTISKIYITSKDYQTNANIIIYKGEKKYGKYNKILGNVELFDLPKKKKGEVKIEVKFFIDINGTLFVSAKVLNTGKLIETRIKNYINILSNKDIKNINEKNQNLIEKKNFKTKLEDENSSVFEDENSTVLEEENSSILEDEYSLELKEGYPLGLYLGSTFSCIGVYRNGGVEIIPNRNGEKTTPSIVTILDKDNILTGEDTSEKYYDSTIYGITRFIGRKFEEAKKEILKENFPFKIEKDERGDFPLVIVDKNNQKIKFTLEEITSFIIKKMVDNAEAFLGKRVNSLVITVPLNFNNSQRNSIKIAAKLAGINILKIINEPIAAALAYGLEKDDNSNSEKEKKVLVFNLGECTFDVTILKIFKGGEQNFDIMSTKGDKFLGGRDFDNRLVEDVLNIFCQKMKESKEEIKKNRKLLKN